MAQLMVRKASDELVKALKQRAAKRNRSAEQEHREILKAALHGPRDSGRWRGWRLQPRAA
jgi:antitoxin FitA